MQSYQIPDIKDFTTKLLLMDTFDTFLLSEASITTFSTFRIDGTFHPEFLGENEAEISTAEKSGYALWRRVRPFFFELMKGKKTPLSFHIVFRLAPHNIEALIRRSGLSANPDDVDGLFLNIRYDSTGLICTSGTSLKVFTLDKSLEHAWDDMLLRFFRQKEIPVLTN